METINNIIVNGQTYEIEDSGVRLTVSELQKKINEITSSYQLALTEGFGIKIEDNTIAVDKEHFIYRDDKTKYFTVSEGVEFSKWVRANEDMYVAGYLTSKKKLSAEDANIFDLYAYTIYSGYGARGGSNYINMNAQKIYFKDAYSYLYSTSDYTWIEMHGDLYGSYSTDYISVRTSGVFLYNEYEVVNTASKRILPTNYYKGSDSLLYVEKDTNSIVPVSHPDLSTQPSILPQRFGNKNIYEVMIPLIYNNIGSINSCNTITDVLHYIYSNLNKDVTDCGRNSKHLCNYYFTTKQNKEYQLFANDLEIYGETEGECLIIFFNNKKLLIDPNEGIVVDLDSRQCDTSLSSEFYEATAINSIYFVVPAKLHDFDTNHGYANHHVYVTSPGDVYVSNQFIQKKVFDKGIKYLYYYLRIHVAHNSFLTFNVNNIPSVDELQKLNLQNNTIIDAKLISQSGAFSPCQVITTYSSVLKAQTLCIKETIPSGKIYDWLKLQYTGSSYNYYDDYSYISYFDSLYRNAELYGSDWYIDMGTSYMWCIHNFAASSYDPCSLGNPYLWGTDQSNQSTEYGKIVKINDDYKDHKDICSIDSNGNIVFNSNYTWTMNSHQPCYERIDVNELYYRDRVIARKKDFEELFACSDVSVKTINGVYGDYFISRKTGNALFLPFGYVYGWGTGPYYWTSDRDSNNTYSIYYYAGTQKEGTYTDMNPQLINGENTLVKDSEWAISRLSYMYIRPVLGFTMRH